MKPGDRVEILEGTVDCVRDRSARSVSHVGKVFTLKNYVGMTYDGQRMWSIEERNDLHFAERNMRLAFTFQKRGNA